MKPLHPLPLLLVIAGCQTAIDPTQHQAMDCAGLNKAMLETSREIGATAISRGNIDSYTVPIWALGGERVKQQLVDRNDRKMSELRSLQNDIAAERRRRCT